MLSRLRQPRYLALTALMLLIGLLCTAAGIWQVARFDEKVRANDALRANFHDAAKPVGDLLATFPATSGPTDDIKLRTVTATGAFQPDRQVLVRNRSVDAPQSDTDDGGTESGFFVLTPFTDSTATLLVVRGFIQGDIAPARLPAPPGGPQTITARVYPSESKDDRLGELPGDLVDSINVAQWAARGTSAIYDGWATLIAGAPGTAQLTAVPDPSLANPAGGAQEWQHLAYVIQWFVFAALAFAAPLLISRHEARLAQRQFLGIDPDARPQLEGSRTAEDGTALVRRERGELRRRSPAEQRHVERATRLADRYGFALEVPNAPLADLLPEEEDGDPTRDTYHGAYNDYLWQIAMADEQENKDGG
ncbi:MAG TPA: SURF1 family protein [Jatrophihabitans sp.]